jgi:hypothetical protein
VSEGKGADSKAASHETGLAPDFFPLFRRILNRGEMAAETRSSQAPTPTTRCFYLAELVVALGYMFVTSHPSSPL